MKMRWTIAISAILSGVAILIMRIGPEPEAEHQPPEAGESSAKPDPPPLPAANPLLYSPPGETSSFPVRYTENGMIERLMFNVNPEKLRKLEGSYSADELKSGAGVYTVPFSSSWILRGTNMPEASFRIELNPESGTYELRGGEISLPQSSFGIFFEKEPETEETRTFLNWEKDF